MAGCPESPSLLALFPWKGFGPNRLRNNLRAVNETKEGLWVGRSPAAVWLGWAIFLFSLKMLCSPMPGQPMGARADFLLTFEIPSTSDRIIKNPPNGCG